ncbi:MAG: ribosome silencing factor [Ignavibacteriaceae bacterium]
MNSRQLAYKIAELIFVKKGFDVKLLDISKLTTMTDYFVICSADSDTQVKAISDEVDKKLRDEGIRCWHTEGYKSLSWVLLDYVDVVVHVFKKEAREFYNLEKLWGDADIISVDDSVLTPPQMPVPKKRGRPKKIQP